VLVSTWYGLRKRERAIQGLRRRGDGGHRRRSTRRHSTTARREATEIEACAPEHCWLKYFHNIAGADLNALFPDVKVGVGWRDQLMLGVPALIGGVPILLKLASTVHGGCS